jgi:hypothetical protein
MVAYSCPCRAIEVVEQPQGTPPFSCACPQLLVISQFVGDEILLVTELSSHQEVMSHVLAARLAAMEYSQEIAKHGLAVKCTGWMAGFPISNCEIDTPSNNGSGTLIDFLGPGIDLGFRLTRFSTPRLMTLSADLTRMLIDAVNYYSAGDYFNFHLQEITPLKGVDQNRPYPIVLLAMNPKGERSLEEQLLRLPEPASTPKLQRFLDEYLDGSSACRRRPFIASDPDKEKWGLIPTEMEEARKQLVPQIDADEQSRHYDAAEAPDMGTQPEGQPPADPKLADLPANDADAAERR